MSPELHPVAAVGFGRAADAYERGRPGFPREAVELVVDRLELRPGRSVMDLAAGTGKFTAELAPTGARVIAVEPVAAMRTSLAAALPSVSTIGGVAEAIPLADASVDAATAAQAFHWFEPDAAIAELHRVLRPDAGLALVWNVRDETVPLQASLTELMEPHRAGTPAHRGDAWRAVFDASDRFTSLERSSFRYEQRTTPQGVVDRVLSVSFIAALEPAEQGLVVERVRALVEGRREIVLPYRTDVWLAWRLGP